MKIYEEKLVRKGSFKWLRNKSMKKKRRHSPYKIGINKNFGLDEMSSMSGSFLTHRKDRGRNGFNGTFSSRREKIGKPTIGFVQNFGANLGLITEVNKDDDTVTLDNTEDENSILQRKLSEMDQYMNEDQVFEARKILDAIRTEKKVIRDERHAKLIRHVWDHSEDANYYYRLLHEDRGWNLVSAKDGVTIHSRKHKKKSTMTIRTHAVFKHHTSKDFIRLVSLFEESDLMPLWIPRGIMKSCKILGHLSKYSKILHFQLSSGKLGIRKPRDAVVEVRCHHLVNQNSFLIICKSIEDSPHCEIPAPEKKQVRIHLENAYMFQLLPSHQIVFRSLSCVDLKMKGIPSTIPDALSRGVIPSEMIMTFRKVVRNFDGSPWQKRIKERLDLYSELERRLREEIDKQYRTMIELSGSDSLATSISEDAYSSSTESSITYHDFSSIIKNYKKRDVLMHKRKKKKPIWRKRNLAILFLLTIICAIINREKIMLSSQIVMKGTLLKLKTG